MNRLLLLVALTGIQIAVAQKKSASEGKRLSGLDSVFEYLIGNISLQVTLKNDALHLLVPGQQEYELVPMESNKFSIKSMTGFTVVFNSNEKNEVTEMLSIQPNGTFKATRKK